ncbi:MAG: SDR family oxidoreductase [Bacteroidales bacterium]|nr:SDR family oxidoreductase [Bacteroidales bacterium]
MEPISFNDLKDKVCVITGGAGVIGTALVQGLASVGTRCAILDINREMAEKTANEIQDRFSVKTIGIRTNVLSKESLEEARMAIHEAMGPVDLLINAAGGNSPKATTQLERIEPENLGELEKTFFGLDMEGFDWVFELNFKGTLLPTMVFAKDMLDSKKGVILNISSMNSFKPLTKIPAYSAAKASINNFTEWLSVHLAPVGIRVNAIAPGFFLTQQNRFLLVDENTGNPTARGMKIISSTPMGRYGKTEELQGTVLYLLSDVSQFVTGIIIPVDGGYSAFGGV